MRAVTRAVQPSVDLEALAARVAPLVARLTPGAWVSLLRAAEHLDEPPESLRKKIERAARGATSTAIDGVDFRRFGRLWKARLSAEWR